MIPDEDKTKEQLINEAKEMRQQVAELEKSEAEHKQVEEALRESEEKYRRLFDLCPIGITTLGMKGMVTSCNPAVFKEGGYSEAEIVGKHFSKIAPTRVRDIPKFVRIFNSIIKGKVPEPIEVAYTRKDGTKGWTEVHVALVEAEGRKLGIQVLQRDTTERKRMEEALRESESFLNSVIEQSPFSTWISDDKGTNIKQNQACRELFGIERDEEVIGKFNVFKDEEVRRQGLIPLIEEAFSKGKIVNFVIDYDFKKVKHVKVPKATHKILDVTIFPIKDGNGKVTNTVFQHRDITEHKQAEEALRESEERFRIASQIASDVVYERDLKTGIATFYGDIDAHLGYEPGGYPRTFEGWREHVHPEDLAWIESKTIDQLEPDVPYSIEYRMRKKDGTYMTWFDRVMVIRDEKTGKPIKFIGAATDITERKLTEQARRESEERYHALLDLGGAVGEAIVMLQDKDGGDAIQIFVSDEWPRITGYSRGELLGMSFFELLHSRHREASLTRHKRRMSGEIIPGLFEMSIIRKDGTEVPIEVTSAYTTYKGERANVAFIRDITERKQAEEREKELQQELSLSTRLASIGELAAGIAHEINNPLTGILGFSERLLRKSTDEEDSQELERIYNEAQRAAKIVQNLLTFARRRQPKKEYLDINDIVQKALELRAYELQTSNIEVVTDLAPGLPEVMADFHQIQEVFLNIILNAEQVMTEASGGGKLSIKTEERKNYIRISFTDDGPGIPTEQLDGVFDPFFTTREERGGTGLGLSACHGIMTEHGGKICARSKPGKGATFFVELPLTTEKIEEAKPS